LANNKLDTNNNETDDRRLGGIFLIIGWIVALSLVAFLVHENMYSTKPPSFIATNSGKQLTISRDYDSHFRITGTINGVPVTFLIDTGATSIAISEHVAAEAGLKKKGEVTTETANGTGVGYLTHIAELQINQIEFKDIAAVIVPNLGSNEALLGMNVLSKFNIQQTDSAMVLTVPAQHAAP
jgi:aspartyl protease family protein